MAIPTTTPVTQTQATRPTAPTRGTGQTGSVAQHVAGRADQTLGARVTPAQAGQQMGAAGPVGSDSLYNAMTQAGMQNVSQPPSERDLRTYYSQHAPHHEQIAAGQYGDAAAAYRADARALPEGDPRRAELESTARQLEFTGGMARGTSFPPTNEQVRGHFRGLRSQPNDRVAREFQNYTGAFFSHVNSDPQGSRSGDLTYTPHTVTRGNTRYHLDTPTGAADVTDRRQLNSSGQRLIDCEGYAFLGNQLLGEAGFRQPREGGFHVVSTASDSNGHAMLEMERNGESVWVSNNHVHRGANGVSNAYNDYRRTLMARGQSAALSDLRDFYGRSEDAALLARETNDTSHRITFEAAR